MVRCGCTLVGRPRAALGAGDLASKPLLPPPLFAGTTGDIPSSTHPQRFIVIIFKATSLLLTGFALFGMFMAAAAIAVSLVPVVRAWQKASAEGVSLSLPDTSLARWSLAR